MIPYHQSLTLQYDNESFSDLCEEAEKQNSDYCFPLLIGYYEWITDLIKQVNDKDVYELSRRQIARKLKERCPKYDPEPIIDLFIKHGRLSTKLEDGKEMIQSNALETTLHHFQNKQKAGRKSGEARATQKGKRRDWKTERQIAVFDADLNARRAAQKAEYS